MRFYARLAPLAALALLAAVAAGCGGGTKALDPVAAAATKTSEVSSLRFDFELALEVGGEPAVALAGEGAVDAAAKRFQAQLEVDGQQIEAIADLSGEPAIYVKPPAGEAALPAGKTWAKLDLADAVEAGGLDLGSLPSEQMDAEQALELLKDAGESTEVGTETVDGVETTHYRVVIDPKDALEQQPEEQRKEAERALGFVGLDTIPLDVWIDGDDLLRRVSLEVGGKDSFFALRLRFDVGDYGDEVEIELPSADEVVDGSGLLPSGAFDPSALIPKTG